MNKGVDYKKSPMSGYFLARQEKEKSWSADRLGAWPVVGLGNKSSYLFSWISSLENRIFVGWFGCLMIPTLLTAITAFIIGFIAAPPVDIDGIREPVAGSLLYGNNIISGAVIPSSNAIGVHFRRSVRAPRRPPAGRGAPVGPAMDGCAFS